MSTKRNISNFEHEFCILHPDGRLVLPEDFLNSMFLQEEDRPFANQSEDPWFAHDFAVLVKKEALGQVTSVGNEQNGPGGAGCNSNNFKGRYRLL